MQQLSVTLACGRASSSYKKMRVQHYCCESIARVVTLQHTEGGRVTTAVSSKTSYLVKGSEAGKSKSDMANKHGTKVIDEDGIDPMCMCVCVCVRGWIIP
jgi:hypothetical protein